MMKDLNKYKKEISLPDFLISHFGFQESSEKSTRSNPRLENRETGEIFIIKKNIAGYYTYWSPKDPEIKGKTILDFMQERLKREGKGASLYQVALTLDNYIRSGKIVSTENSVFRLAEKRYEISSLEKEIKPLMNQYFFKKRGISEHMLETPVFKNIFGEREYFDKKKGKVYSNVVVKLFDETGLVGISQRNLHFKGCLASRSEALAATNPDRSRPVDVFYIGESMIDNVSHYEMNYDSLKDKNVVYFSSEGCLTPGQINLLQKSLDKIKPDKLVSLYDNDIAGQCFTLNLFGNIVCKGMGEGITMRLKDNIKENFIECEFEMPECLSELKSKDFPPRFFSESMSGDVILGNQEKVGEEAKVLWTVRFQRVLENVKEFVDKTRVFRLGETVGREMPLTNDFNDDIRVFKGIHPDWKIEQVNGKYIGMRSDEMCI